MSMFHSKNRLDPIPTRMGSMEITKQGAIRYDLRDPYHLAMTLSWPRFFLTLLVLELTINIVFALLYVIAPGSLTNTRPYSFSDAFFFSIETLATVGYGAMAPATLYGHIVSAIEILCGMTFTALMTGLIFVRFSRPKAKILFADNPVIGRSNGRPTLMIRLGNGRMSLLADATARLSVLLPERTAEGQMFRRTLDLSLTQSRLPLFGLIWTLMHPIDEHSPLARLTVETLAESDLRLILIIEARDHVMGAHVFDLHTYDGDAILFGTRYQDALSIDDRGRTNADLTRLSLVEPDDPPGERMGEVMGASMA
ncbi:MAG TPA: ion channel [Stellaceae bacterium]|nr:ion channel [Stellaceae bacterium]